MSIPALIIRDLVKVYENDLVAINGINLKVEQGDFFALLGPNGAGKSSIIGVLSSLVRKTDGEVSILGYDIDKDFNLAKKLIGIVPQEVNCNMFEKVENILISATGYYGIPKDSAIPRVHFYLKRLGLWEKRRDISKSLSGGMKRRLMIARALIHQPELLILDEPTAGVDIELRRGMWDFLTEINAKGTTIILTTHYLEEAEALCKNVAIIDRGKIVAISPLKEMLASLNKMTFVCDLEKPMDGIPKIDGWEFYNPDPLVLEIVVDNGRSLNEVFRVLTEKEITVISIRTKTNRLEQFFLEKTKDPDQ